VDRKAGEARLEPGTIKNQAGRVFPFTDALRTLLGELWTQHEALQKNGDHLSIRVSSERETHEGNSEGLGECLC
jgi:hypothetical protein